MDGSTLSSYAVTPGVGRVVKNIHTCTFCMGEQADGLPDAQRLDEVVAGVPVPYLSAALGLSPFGRSWLRP